jgi:hypothetical protein
MSAEIMYSSHHITPISLGAIDTKEKTQGSRYRQQNSLS